MLGTIGFNDLRVSCIIGIEPHERTDEQELIIDFKVEIDFTRVSISDDIQDTVNYVALANYCRELAQQKKYLLIEKYAAAVVKGALDLFPIKSAWVLVKKPSAIADAAYALVEFKQERS